MELGALYGQTIVIVVSSWTRPGTHGGSHFWKLIEKRVNLGKAAQDVTQ